MCSLDPHGTQGKGANELIARDKVIPTFLSPLAFGLLPLQWVKEVLLCPLN